MGDLAVIDISATTIDEDGSTGEAIPDAESKGFRKIESHILYSLEITLPVLQMKCWDVWLCVQVFILTQKKGIDYFLDSLIRSWEFEQANQSHSRLYFLNHGNKKISVANVLSSLWVLLHIHVMITTRSFLDKANRVCFLQVDCKELFYRDLPTLDDSLADKLLPGCTTLQGVMNTWSQLSTSFI